MPCQHSCKVNASADDVWATLRNFHDFGWAEGVIETSENVGDRGPHEAGAVRLLNGVFRETLLDLDDASMTLRYSIDDAPGTPVADAVDYVGVVRVRPEDVEGTASIDWSSSWSGGKGGVAEFCNPIYAALMGALKNRFGSGRSDCPGDDCHPVPTES